MGSRGKGLAIWSIVFIVGLVTGSSWPWSSAQTPPAEREVEKPAEAKPRKPSDATRERFEVKEKDGTYEARIDFPSKEHPQRTSWRILYKIAKIAGKGQPRENFIIQAAYFTPSPDHAEFQVLGQTHLAESMVAYSNGTRFYDIGDQQTGVLPATTGDLGDYGIHASSDHKVVAELHDRGLLWKVGRTASRRAEVLQLWSTLEASNYLYIVQIGFQDDGGITFRMGSTGSNLEPNRQHTHMHLGIWRVDIDLGDNSSNNASIVRHREPFGKVGLSTDVIEPFNGGVEGFAEWNDKEFTTLRFSTPKMHNGMGNTLSYDLIPIRTGSARHYGLSPASEAFTHADFYVLPYSAKNNIPDEMNCTKLPDYLRKGRSINNTDIVLWYISSAYHMPRDEDFQGEKGSRRPGATVVLWSGFDLKPRDVFDSTPFYRGGGRGGKGAMTNSEQ